MLQVGDLYLKLNCHSIFEVINPKENSFLTVTNNDGWCDYCTWYIDDWHSYDFVKINDNKLLNILFGLSAKDRTETK